MKFTVGQRVKMKAVPELGSFRVVAARKIGPWWEYDLENETDQGLRERVAETQIDVSPFSQARKPKGGTE